MKVRFSKRSIRRLSSIQAYVAKDSPAAAARVAARIAETAMRLEHFPLLGRPGKKPGWREVIVPGLPYIIPYRVVDDLILVDTIIHTSRKWPYDL
jgi:toxin ParE1/3/4